MIFQTITAFANPETGSKMEAATHGLVESGHQGLAINAFDIGFYLVCFLIAMLVLNKFLFKPLNKIIDERQARIEKALDEAELIEAKLNGINDQAKVITDQAKAEARQIIEDAKAEMDPAKAKVIADAESQKANIIASATEQGDKIVASANATAQKEVMNIVQMAIKKATSNLNISGSAQNEIMGSIINTKL
jgi:F-type H+-transporting ATPase subunit b